ncbi:MAG TPA: heavy metal-binding domain-containing protein [Flavobacterium sp.]|jgi:hypothetical protein
MKNLIFSAILMAVVTVSCKNKEAETDAAGSSTAETTMDTSAVETSAAGSSTGQSDLFACSMHPEATGKRGDKCPKCDMELTEHVEID